MTIRGKDFINAKEITEDDCGVCEVHKQAFEKIFKDNVLCPKCNKPLQFVNISNTVVIGETNAGDIDTLKEEIFRNAPTIICENCNAYISLIPTEVIHNANHGIYYTGGKNYIPDDLKIDLSKIEAHVKQYTERIKQGENILSPWHLMIWIQNDIEKIIATELYKRGLKI